VTVVSPVDVGSDLLLKVLGEVVCSLGSEGLALQPLDPLLSKGLKVALRLRELRENVLPTPLPPPAIDRSLVPGPVGLVVHVLLLITCRWSSSLVRG
jgi:hypothetical protein